MFQHVLTFWSQRTTCTRASFWWCLYSIIQKHVGYISSTGQPLFHQVILMSGSDLCEWSFVDNLYVSHWDRSDPLEFAKDLGRNVSKFTNKVLFLFCRFVYVLVTSISGKIICIFVLGNASSIFLTQSYLYISSRHRLRACRALYLLGRLWPGLWRFWHRADGRMFTGEAFWWNCEWYSCYK